MSDFFDNIPSSTSVPDNLLDRAHAFGAAAGEVARLDQTTAGYRDFAQIIGSYHRALLAQGFRPEEAFELVRDYQSNLMFMELPSDGLGQ